MTLLRMEGICHRYFPFEVRCLFQQGCELRNLFGFRTLSYLAEHRRSVSTDGREQVHAVAASIPSMRKHLCHLRQWTCSSRPRWCHR